LEDVLPTHTWKQQFFSGKFLFQPLLCLSWDDDNVLKKPQTKHNEKSIKKWENNDVELIFFLLRLKDNDENHENLFLKIRNFLTIFLQLRISFACRNRVIILRQFFYSFFSLPRTILNTNKMSSWPKKWVLFFSYMKIVSQVSSLIFCLKFSQTILSHEIWFLPLWSWEKKSKILLKFCTNHTQ
jgi:hypothetical protein